MMMQAPSAPGPRKLFREEAQTSSAQCPGCGAPLELKGFGGIERVVCVYCGSESTPKGHSELQLLAQARRQRRQSAIPLYRRGVLDHVEWEVLGIVWRECEVSGTKYPWQEFLLFNPYRGYRYLIYGMSDGHWTFGGALPGAPQFVARFGHKQALFRRTRYVHFQTVTAKVTYVEGEFPWQIRVGDSAQAHEYIAPPATLSVEETHGEDGQDVNFTLMHHVSGRDVWSAFKLPGRPPPRSGVGSCHPNPWKQGRSTTRLSLAVFLVAWLVCAWLYAAARDEKVIFSRNNVPITEGIRQEITIAGRGETVLELELHAYPLSNAWAYVDVILSSDAQDEGLAFGATAEEWHGVDGGESWREGNANPSIVIGHVKPGTYVLEVTPSAGTQAGPAPAGMRYDLTLRQDVLLLRYVFLPLVVILLFPFLYWLFAAFYETRRWSNSDYSSSD